MDTSLPYAFLSYSRQDKAVADKLTGALAARGVRIWKDVEQIAPGAKWEQELEKGLVGASAIIFFASRNSSTSRWMTYEVEAFLKRNKLVLPLILDLAGVGTLPPALHSLQWVDISSGFEYALDSIVKVLADVGVASPKPIVQTSLRTKGYVFLSYAEEDSDFVETLRPFLETHGYAYWDFQESDRDYHGHFIIELEDIILNAAATISILSASWKISKWTLREFLFSEEVKTPVLLLLAKPMPPSLATQGTPYIDFITSTSSGIERLHRELKRKGL